MSIHTTKKAEDPTKVIIARLAALEKIEVAFGWIDDAEAATIAGYNHFGNPAGNLPARDALTPTRARTDGEAGQAARNAGEAAARGKDPRAAVEGLAPTVARELQQSIRDFSDPPNAPRTIRQKGFDDPLIGKGDGGRILRHAGAKARPREG